MLDSEDVEAIGVTPRALGFVTSMEIHADIPGEGDTVLAEFPDYDPHWRHPFLFKESLYLPARTIIRCHWTINNTESNARNPFVPIDRLSLARRTGAVAALLHVAAEDPEADVRLQAWHGELMRSRGR